MPAPAISIQPLCLQTRQPAPLQRWQEKSTSTLGSVNGKKCGRKRTLTAGPIISRAKCASVLFRSASDTGFTSTYNPSIWWKFAACVASVVSRR